ncbi:hypothetical protein FEE95_06080 [Maribacter algarum]|uniref:Glycosyltransferase RgtA/B/C/D-like domain-containing protein n=1 Tax=Maribacter algarum (ex Zhang et al. 2020) TaxID=2578118 RepID=A0A5S3PVH0_9FLAO|nr:hypothetical protein [Maribacter algarum]TMM58999.1 hypothetical protein FEE95_06080 [Maribacter algarum]
MPNKTPNLVFSILLGLFNLSAVGVIVWASYRGLELSDESFYYLGYRYFNSSPDLSAASFHLIYGRFFSFLDLSLTGVRLLRLFLTLLASLVLYIGIAKHKAPASWPGRFILFNVILSGMLLSYTWTPMALSYNTMSSILIACVIGFWLLNLKSKKQAQNLCWAILGGLFVLLFFIKATNLILLPLVLFGELYWRYIQNSQKKRIPKLSPGSIITFVLGILGMLIFVSRGVGPIPETVDTHLQQLFGLANTDSTHTFSYLWNKYYTNAEMVFLKLLFPVLSILILYIFAKVYSRKSKDETFTWPIKLFKILGIIILLVFIVHNEYWKGGIQYRYHMLIPFIFGFVFVLLNQNIESEKINFIFLLGLLSVPVAGSIGTNNGLSAQILFYGVFVFLLIYYVIQSSKATWYTYIILGIMMLIATSQVISGTVLRPYRLSPLDGNKNKLYGVDALNNLKVDTAVFELSENLKSLKTIDSEYIFTYSGMMGVNLLLDKKPYSLEWFNESDDEKICLIITKSQITSDNILFMIPEKFPLTEKVISCFAEKGIDFKADYLKIKSFECFYPRNNTNITLEVYQHVSK